MQPFTHLYGLSWKFVLLQSDLQEDTVKVLHESGPILHEGGPTQRMVLKAVSKMVLAASQLQEIER